MSKADQRDATVQMEWQQEADEIIFNRPVLIRLVFGFFAISLAVLLWYICHEIVCEIAAAAPDDTLSRSDYVLIYSLPAFFLGSLCLVFLWMAGSYQVMFNLHHRQYTLTQGIPFITRTKHGATEGGIFYIARTRGGQYHVRFRPLGDKWGFLIDTHETDKAARTQAWELADALGLGVECRDTGNAP